MSRSGTPTLPFILPMYEHMRRQLKKHADDSALSPHIRNAVVAGLFKLDEYYAYAKDSQFTILATGEPYSFYSSILRAACVADLIT